MIAHRRQTQRLRPLLLLLVVAALGLTFWWLYSAFQQRHWNAFSQAGDRALERGNYEWAEKMYQQALQYAQTKKNEEKTVQSYLLLHRLYKRQGEEELAAEMINRARQLHPVDMPP